MKKIIPILLFAILPLRLFSSPQMPDYIIYKKDTIATYNLILEEYLQKTESIESEKLFGLSFRNNSSFNCWRGYQAIYKIENDSLFLVDIIDCGELDGKFNKSQSLEKIKSIFGEKFKREKVYIDWFNGSISFPLTDKILRWDGVFYKTFEREKIITISNGIAEKIEDVGNYIDDPKRINRKVKDKISPLFFKKLKKAKWKNSNNFDCATAYLVTINEKGNVSKVRMTYSTEQILEFYEVGESEFCTKKILEILKDLKFDVIKNRGIPISEDIYINIWIEDDGEIKNWTEY